MAYGTQSVPKVFKIFGPGNQYVTLAKQLVQQDGLAIDMPAGPSEVLVIADESANPAFVAADLLSQAEHGPDSQAILLTTSEELANQVSVAVQEQLNQLPRKNIAARALKESRILVLNNLEEAMAFSNLYAPEHLILSCENAEEVSGKITNAGSVFIGNYYEMNVIGFNAKDVPAKYSIKTAIREYFAKLKAVLDLYVFHTEPKFLGEEVKIKI